MTLSPTAKKVLIRVGIIAGIVSLLGVLGFIVYKQIQISNKQDLIEARIISEQQLIDGIVRSQSTWATKGDVEKFISDNNVNLRAIQDDLDKLKAELTAVNVAVANSRGQTGTNIPSTGTGNTNPTPVDPKNPDPYGYMQKQQNLSLNEDFGTVQVPFGTVGFSAWQEKPWNYEIKDREYNVASVVGTDENQRMYFYNKFTLKVDGKSYNIPIKAASTQQVYPEAKFSWFNPRLYAGIDTSVGVTPIRGEFTPSLNFQIMSYGRYKTQPDLSVLQLGLGYGINSQRPQVVVTPISYNVGKHIPFMNNTYFGPAVGVGTDGNVMLGAGLRFGL